MNVKKLFISTVIVGTLVIGASIAGAQDNGNRGRGGRGGNGLDLEIAETYTGLTREEIITAVRGGETLAQLIEANGQSVEAFITEVVSETTAKIDARTATIKAKLESNITARVYGERPPAPEPTATPNA